MAKEQQTIRAASHVVGRLRITRHAGRIASVAIKKNCRVFMSCRLFLLSVTCITTAFAIWQGAMAHFY
jgi:hypothetical protein